MHDLLAAALCFATIWRGATSAPYTWRCRRFQIRRGQGMNLIEVPFQFFPSKRSGGAGSTHPITCVRFRLVTFAQILNLAHSGFENLCLQVSQSSAEYELRIKQEANPYQGIVVGQGTNLPFARMIGRTAVCEALITWRLII